MCVLIPPLKYLCLNPWDSIFYPSNSLPNSIFGGVSEWPCGVWWLTGVKPWHTASAYSIRWISIQEMFGQLIVNVWSRPPRQPMTSGSYKIEALQPLPISPLTAVRQWEEAEEWSNNIFLNQEFSLKFGTLECSESKGQNKCLQWKSIKKLSLKELPKVTFALSIQHHVSPLHSPASFKTKSRNVTLPSDHCIITYRAFSFQYLPLSVS